MGQRSHVNDWPFLCPPSLRTRPQGACTYIVFILVWVVARLTKPDEPV